MGREHSKLRQEIRKALEAEGALVVPQPAGAETGPGISDMLVCWPGGYFVAVEVKTIFDELRPDQISFLERVRRRGGIAIEGRSPEQTVQDIKKGRHEQSDRRLRS